MSQVPNHNNHNTSLSNDNLPKNGVFSNTYTNMLSRRLLISESQPTEYSIEYSIEDLIDDHIHRNMVSCGLYTPEQIMQKRENTVTYFLEQFGI